MADPTAFYEPEEDELLSSLPVQQAYQGTESYDDEYRRLASDYAAGGAGLGDAGSVGGESAMGLETVPEDVKRVSAFLVQSKGRGDLWIRK